MSSRHEPALAISRSAPSPEAGAAGGIRPRDSLRVRVLLAFLLVLLIGGAVAAAGLIHTRHRPLAVIEQNSLSEQVAVLRRAMRQGVDGIDSRLPREWARAYANPAIASYTIYSPTGAVIAASPNLGDPLPRLPLATNRKLGPVYMLDQDRSFGVASPGPRGTTIVVSRRTPLEVDRQFLASIERDETLFALVLLFVLAPLLLWWVLNWSLRPIERAAEEAAAIGPGDVGARLSTVGVPNELRPLVGAVNDALDRLGRALEAERRLAADAAHGLRTPLSVLDLRVQRALAGEVDWPALSADVARLRQMIDQLLGLTRREAAGPPAAMPVNLARVASEAAASIVVLVEEAGRSLAVDLPDTAIYVLGDADELRDMIANLLENAFLHGEGRITLRLREEGDRLVLIVADEGPGVPEERRERVFDRFISFARDGRGGGLGLSIVRQVAARHGGQATITDEGAVVTLPRWTGPRTFVETPRPIVEAPANPGPQRRRSDSPAA